jgi:hypothetical protein
MGLSTSTVPSMKVNTLVLMFLEIRSLTATAGSYWGKAYRPAQASRFHSSQVGLGGDIEIAIPKSINRLRLKGAGSRYVHGGASLQEVVIPVIKINKKRESDISKVEIEVIRSPLLKFQPGNWRLLSTKPNQFLPNYKGGICELGFTPGMGT